MLYSVNNTTLDKWENIEAEPWGVRPDVARVSGFGVLSNLAPGDLVRVEDGRIVGIYSIAPQWVFEVYAAIPTITYLKDPLLRPDPSLPELFAGLIDTTDPLEWELAQEVARATLAELDGLFTTEGGGLVTKVAMKSRAGFDAWLRTGPAIAFCDILRRPSSKLIWQAGLPAHGPLDTILPGPRR